MGDEPIIIEQCFMGSRGLLWVRLWEVKILWVRIMGVTLVFCPARVSVPEITAMMSLKLWDEIAKHACRVTRSWLSFFPENESLLNLTHIVDIFV